MAKTYTKRNIGIRIPANSFLGYPVRRLPEGASQTFIAFSPVVLTAGLIVKAADPIGATNGVYGIAVKAGQNTTAALADPAEVVAVVDGVEIMANLLSGDGTGNNTLAADDLGKDLDFEENDVNTSSAAMWHIADSTSGVSIKVISFENEMQLPNEVESSAVAGDINARVSCVFMAAARAYN